MQLVNNITRSQIYRSGRQEEADRRHLELRITLAGSCSCLSTRQSVSIGKKLAERRDFTKFWRRPEELAHVIHAIVTNGDADAILSVVSRENVFEAGLRSRHCSQERRHGRSTANVLASDAAVQHPL